MSKHRASKSCPDLCVLRKTLYVKPFLGQFESKRKISRKKRERNAFNKA
jgi:hypothetical protein